MTTQNEPDSKQPSGCPEGYLNAGYVVPLRLTVRQETYCRRAIGVARFTYNLCVATHQFHRTNRLPWPSVSQMAKTITLLKHDEFPFLSEVSHRVTDGAIANFATALRKWRDSNDRAHRPRFHKKRVTGTGSFRAAGAVREIHYDRKRRIRLPYLGSVKLAHTLPEGIIHEAHISRHNGQWLLSINYWKPPLPKPDPDTRVPQGAVDTGINPLATDSEGQTWENPRAYYAADRKLARWQRAQARRTKGSRGWWEAQRRIDRLHRRINGLRKNAQHQMTSELVNKFQHLAVEDLHVWGLMQGRTPKAQADASMASLTRQLLYKSQWRHCNVVLAPRFYPSRKLCSNCQTVNVKLKRERYWQCSACGTHHQRNLNAAVNLRDLLALLPSAGGTLRDGKALAAGTPGSETSPNDRRTATLSMRAPPTVDRWKV